MKYPKGFNEYVTVMYERVQNKTHIARSAIKFFGLEQNEESVRKKVRNIIKKTCLDGEKKPIKRLFFDIETSFIIGWFWRTGWKQTIGTHQIITPKKAICICYKWQGSNEVHSLQWNKKQDDSAMLKKFIKVLGEADEIIGHNIDKFDIKELRTRCILTKNLMFPKYRTLDTLKKARSYFSFDSNKLDYIGEVLKVGRKIETNKKLWEDVILKKDKKALDEMVKYCKKDVILTEDVFTAMMPYIDHNTNFAVLKSKGKWHCPECSGDNVVLSHTDTTPMGYIKRHMKCRDCKKFYPVSNKTYLRFIKSLAPDPDKLK